MRGRYFELWKKNKNIEVSKNFNFGNLKSKISTSQTSLLHFVYAIYSKQRDCIFILWVHMINPKVNVHNIIQGQSNSLSLKIK